MNNKSNIQIKLSLAVRGEKCWSWQTTQTLNFLAYSPYLVFPTFVYLLLSGSFCSTSLTVSDGVRLSYRFPLNFPSLDLNCAHFLSYRYPPTLLFPLFLQVAEWEEVWRQLSSESHCIFLVKLQQNCQTSDGFHHSNRGFCSSSFHIIVNWICLGFGGLDTTFATGLYDALLFCFRLRTTISGMDRGNFSRFGTSYHFDWMRNCLDFWWSEVNVSRNALREILHFSWMIQH